MHAQKIPLHSSRTSTVNWKYNSEVTNIVYWLTLLARQSDLCVSEPLKLSSSSTTSFSVDTTCLGNTSSITRHLHSESYGADLTLVSITQSLSKYACPSGHWTHPSIHLSVYSLEVNLRHLSPREIEGMSPEPEYTVSEGINLASRVSLLPSLEGARAEEKRHRGNEIEKE